MPLSNRIVKSDAATIGSAVIAAKAESEDIAPSTCLVKAIGNSSQSARRSGVTSPRTYLPP